MLIPPRTKRADFRNTQTCRVDLGEMLSALLHYQLRWRTSTGRLGKDPVEEKAVRAVLREAAASRRSTLAASASAAQRDRHPALEAIDETGGSGGSPTAAAAAAAEVPAAVADAAVAPSMFPPPPLSAADGSRQTHESNRPVGPPPSPTTVETLVPAQLEHGMPGEGAATPEGLDPPLPTPPPSVQAPPAMPTKGPLPPPPPPPPKPAAATDACRSSAAVARSQFPTPLADTQVQQGVEVVPAAGAGGETEAATAIGFACGNVMEGEYELEKVGVLCSPPHSWFATACI